MKKAYKIRCEWDMGEGWETAVFSTKKAAEASATDANWSMVGMTLEEVLEDGLVEIEEVDSL